MALKRILDLFRRMIPDVAGASAIEFAIIAPMMILLYCGMAELSSALMAARKAGHAVSTVGDVVSRLQTSADGTSMAGLFLAGGDVMAPFPTTTIVNGTTVPIQQARITSLTMQPDKSIQVVWSCSPASQTALPPYAANTVVVSAPGSTTTPSNNPLSTLLINPGDNVIMSEGSYNFTSPADYLIQKPLSFNNTFYFKPRSGAPIAYAGPGAGPSAQCNG
ncbi:MAG: TadE/TadG family type IV pilus assembly protein [Caulobacteraceae bacterium]